MTDVFDGPGEEQTQREEIQVTVTEVLRNNKWATRIEVTLIAVMVIAVMISVTFMALAVQQGNEQRRAIVGLTRVIQTYNEEHAKQAEDSFRALNESQECAILKLFTGEPFEQIHPEEVAACYRPVAPAPPPPTTTTTGGKR